MKNTKTFKVVMLPTEKANGAIVSNGKTAIKVGMNYPPSIDFKPQHLYIISDEEIEEGDRVEFEGKILTVTTCNLARDRNIIYAHYDNGNGIGIHKDNFKKVISSTDKSLTLSEPYKEYKTAEWLKKLPSIPESFIKAYIKAYNEGKPITEVDLEMIEVANDYGIISNESIAEVYALNAEEDNAYEIRLRELGGPNRVKLVCKTRPDGSVIVHRSKMYSSTEVEKIITSVFDDVHTGKIMVDKSRYYDFDCSPRKWIEENL